MHYLADKNDQLKKKDTKLLYRKSEIDKKSKENQRFMKHLCTKEEESWWAWFCSTCCTYLANFANLALPYCSGSSFYLGEFRPILKWVIALLGDFNALLYSSLLDVHTASRGDRGPFCKAQKLERRGELSCSSVFFERLQENITKNGCSFIELCRALNCMWSEKVVVVAIIAFFHADLPWLKNEHFLDHCTPITNKVSR